MKGEYHVPSHEWEKREVYTCMLTLMKPKEIYVFRIMQEGWDSSKVYYYKNFDPEKMTIINGGDIGNVKRAMMINTNVIAQANADVIFVGGDISYDNNIPE